MRFVHYDEYRTEAIRSGKLIVYPDFRDSIWFQKVVAGIDDTHSKRVCEVLNQINNQGIEEVFVTRLQYVIRSETLPLNCLSTGERIFLLGYALCAVDEMAYLQYGFNQLSEKSCRLFMRLFNKCRLTVLCVKDMDLEYYRLLLKECSNGIISRE